MSLFDTLMAKKLRQKEINFVRGYYCCLAALLHSHGDNTYIHDLIFACGTKEEIIKYADSGDVEILREAGHL